MAIDASLVFYTGLDLSYIDVVSGDTLYTALVNINAAVNDMNPAPDYTSYNLYCITQTDGSSHPTNTQNFAEGISKIVCDNKDEYDTFVGTTYVSDQVVVNAAISALQVPALSYSVTAGGGSITITSGMTRNQVLTATYTGVGDILTLLGTPGTTWSTLSITDPTNLSSAFNSVIAYLSALTTTVNTKQDEIPTYDNSINCLAGTASDTIAETVTLLTAYACDLPDYDASTITWLGVSAGVDLQTTIQTLVNTTSSILTNGVVDAGTGLTESSVGSTYQGKKLSIDTTYTQLYKVMTDSADTSPDFLGDKIESSDSSITITMPVTPGDPINLTVTTPNDNKVKVNSSDSTAGYLEDKITGSADGGSGIATYVTTASDDSTLNITTAVSNWNTMWQSLIGYALSDPQILTDFNNLVVISSGSPGTPITDLVVELNAGDFVLTWTDQGGNSQQAKWRQRGGVSWTITDFTPANPLSAVDDTTTAVLSDTNIPYQFQVDTIYSTGLIGSNIFEMISYECQSVTTGVATQEISVTQSVLADVAIIEYNLWNTSPSVLVETITTTGSSPSVTFAAVAAGTYDIKWRYGTTINGTTLYSDDASQLGAMCEETGIVVS